MYEMFVRNEDECDGEIQKVTGKSVLEKAGGRERAYPVLTWGHTGRLHTSQLGPVGEGRDLSDSDSWLALRQCQR